LSGILSGLGASPPQEVPAHLSYHDVAPTAARAVIVSRTESQRVARAVGGGLACWGLALVSVFIPLGHFVLVPAFLIAGPVLFAMRLTESVSLLGARGPCPVCGVDQPFTEKGRLRTPHPVRCSACGRQLSLSLTTIAIDDARPALSGVRTTITQEAGAQG
jgi:hypothetical protein